MQLFVREGLGEKVKIPNLIYICIKRVWSFCAPFNLKRAICTPGLLRIEPFAHRCFFKKGHLRTVKTDNKKQYFRRFPLSLVQSGYFTAQEKIDNTHTQDMHVVHRKQVKFHCIYNATIRE